LNLVYTVATASLAMTTIVAGLLLDYRGPRVTIAVCCISSFIGYFFWAISDSRCM